MPIRTNRGRAAVYRKLWGWPLRSPKHLVVVGLFALAVVLFLGYILPRLTGSPSAQNTAATSSSSARPTTPASTPSQGAPGVVPPPAGTSGSPSSALPTATRQSPSESRTPAKADPKALEAVSKWAEAFMNHPDGVTDEQWQNGLRPWTTEEYLSAKLARIDPRTIPGTKVTGSPVATPDSYTNSVRAEVPTDGKKLSITVIKTPEGWRVNEHGEVG